MLSVLAIGLAACAGLVAMRWAIRPSDALGRARRFPYYSVGFLLALAGLALVPGYLRHSEEHRLAEVASTLAGTTVEVHCQTLGQSFFQLNGDAGWVKYGADGRLEHRTTLDREVCNDLRSYLSSDKSAPTPDRVIAVHVLTHESMHMRGITSEAAAECAAVQRDVVTAQLLGATPAEADALARMYWHIDYPQMPSGYRSADCTANGSMDEQLPDPPWS